MWCCPQEEWQKRLRKTEIELNLLRAQKDEEIKELKDQVYNTFFFKYRTQQKGCILLNWISFRSHLFNIFFAFSLITNQ